MATKPIDEATRSIIIDRIITSFNYDNEVRRIRPNIRPVRIRVRGQFVSLSSGKRIWNTVGFAKSALTNHLSHIGYYPNEGWRTHTSAAEVKAIVNSLIEDGTIEFVPITEIP